MLEGVKKIRVLVLQRAFLSWITSMVWPCCSEFLIYWKSFSFLYLHLQELLHLRIYSSRYLRGKKAKIRHNMSEWGPSIQKVLKRGESLIDSGVQSLTRASDVKAYRFILFQGPKWGVFWGANLIVSLQEVFTSQGKNSLTLPTVSNFLILLVRKLRQDISTTPLLNSGTA